MDRSQKADLVAELKNVFNETSVVVITRNLGHCPGLPGPGTRAGRADR